MNTIIGNIVSIMGLACLLANIIVNAILTKRIKAMPDGEIVTALKRFEKPLKICKRLIIIGTIFAIAGTLIRGFG